MDQFKHFNPHTSYNKVYINRNFNRNGADRIPTIPSNVYFNPNFSYNVNQHYNAQQINHSIRPKIHVNPNFIRSKTQDMTHSHLNTTASSATHAYNQISITQPIQAIPDNREKMQMITVSNSRYSLVRQNEKKTPLLTSLPVKRTQQTVKVNKYKLVSLNSVKKSLIDKKPTNRSVQPTQIKLNQTVLKSKYKLNTKSVLNVQNNRFKLIKRNSTDSLQGMVRRVSITHSNSIIKTSFRQTKKIVPGSMKKNNIPCPLFKKYGKCLRMVRGSCDYLHDKKHVSICRKFLKGICHDKQCLLSHDMTDKKMPTCYFYLQGNCTKEGCPYLHVKLNEKTKICPNFLKGYCENGDKCVHRHVNVSINRTTKLVKNKKSNLSIIINKKYPERVKLLRTNTGEEDKTSNKEASSNDKEFNKDQRYFKEMTEEISEQYDLIKPIRCKLGSLPSFIQL